MLVSGSIGDQASSAWNTTTKVVGFGVDVFNQTWGRVDDFTGHAARHAVDSIGGLGLPGLTWNSRDAYRTRYNPTQRLGAAVGDIAGIGVSGLLFALWKSRGFSAGSAHGPLLAGARVLGGVALAAMAASSIRKGVDDTLDDGNLRALGAVAGGVGGWALARRLHAPWWVAAPMAIGLGVGGAFAGGLARFSPGHVGEHAPYVMGPLGGKLQPVGFARGMWNHFVEEGPLSQGVSFGGAWHERDAYDSDQHYNDAERVGGMVGDLGAMLLVGTGSVAVAGRILGYQSGPLFSSRLGRAAMGMSLPARVVNALMDVTAVKDTVSKSPLGDATDIANRIKDPVLGRGLQEEVTDYAKGHFLKFDGKFPQLLYAAGIGLVGYTIYQAWDSGQNGKNPLLNGPMSAIAAAGLIIGGGVLVSHHVPFVKALSGSARPAMAMATSAAALAALFSVRGALDSFGSDAVELHRRRPVSWGPVQAGITGGGALAGASLGWIAAGKLGLSGTGRWAGAALGALAGAGVSIGFLPALAAPRAVDAGDPASEPAATTAAR